ncbi:MAG: transposase [Acholeplasma sp.]|nr:transposase [Acholeplasma sp.]
MKTYEESFKKKVVELYENGKKASLLCSEYDITRPTLYMWIKKYKTPLSVKLSGKESLTVEEQQLLIKELEQAKLENEILKKAVLIIGKK